MIKTIKAIGIVTLGLLVWIGILYLGMAFIKAEPNFIKWSEPSRFIIAFMAFIYVMFLPLIVGELKDKI